uniref:NADH dehydrogenase subunit 4L n=1 Tax=Azygia hwangtsiyui TaxID=2752791 RepID=A0A7D5TY11_9TREM|nr:NADH dehydrogenase subunit 4L [Azygia hwangtsiyui]QLH90209.1 NADH dehydrogenase subunit 4L [Azygia hwangtsiyui]
MEVFFLIGLLLILFSFVFSLGCLLKCLIVIENINVLLLVVSLMGQGAESRVLFLALIVVFTIEVTLGLVVLTRLWDYSSLIDVQGV